jgi:hypothetical protein
MIRRILTVAPLDPPIRSGDWHDRPLRWTVTGEDAITQHFHTKKDAKIWARCYGEAVNFCAASRMWDKLVK